MFGFTSPMAPSLAAFLEFKRGLGHPYRRAEFTLRSFDRFVRARVEEEPDLALETLVLRWISSMAGRKPVSVANEVGVIRQFCLYLRRRAPEGFVPGRVWAPQSTESRFLPHILSEDDVCTIVTLTASLRGSPFRRLVHRVLVLVLYCTGLRFGEAVRLRLRDVEIETALLHVHESKGRSRYVPFGDDLLAELRAYRAERDALAGTDPDRRFLVRPDGSDLPVKAASDAVRGLLRRAGLKPRTGRRGPRPYDLRHTFAVHRLTRWYREGADIQAHLPLLSAYMGHHDLLGTEAYLRATPELLALAAERLETRLLRGDEP